MVFPALIFRAIETIAVTVHFAFIGYVVLGGFLAWHWRRTIVLHLFAVAWGFGSVLVGYDCPLTDLENWARGMAGGPPLPSSGFIAYYITGVLYPVDAVNLVRLLVAALVLVSWAGFVLRRRAAVPVSHS
ncbi:DUF2784 domain-containing protein [Rhodococcus spelaei]|uniref:DUF2784 domain-containing protein n=1 Tax=Rhodococcus spelaei TaxID=2546320 RepID=A0A541BNY1_9NOCA|nr:DUF2784 domain-containing protein [Rhodococcus spelaei]TQF74022.1 DUF2784 domain-containing protein [Rhodococcus spelaei]